MNNSKNFPQSQDLFKNFPISQDFFLSNSEFESVIKQEVSLQKRLKKEKNGDRAACLIWCAFITVILAGPLQAWGLCGIIAGVKLVLATIFAELSD